MMRALMLSACLWALEAKKIHITLEPDAPPPTTTEPTPGSPHIQLLKNIKAKGVQAFVGEISVGTPPQEMSVGIDTVSALSYFPSVRCEDPSCTMRRRYNSSASSTYEAVGTPFDLPAGQNISGTLSKDSVELAGVSVDEVVFGEAEHMWNKWQPALPSDGRLGLGLAGDAPEGVRPLLDVMAEQGLIQERVFGLWLGRDPEGGELTLGGLNERLYQGELTWADLAAPGQWWAVPAKSVTLEGHPELDFCPADGAACSIMPESSTPYFIVSPARAKAINDVLGGMDVGEPGVSVLDCTTLYKLPNLKIQIAGRTMEMGPLEYTFLLRFPGGTQMCISGFLGIPTVPDTTIITGTLFMQKNYVAFDRENGRLGFADSV